MSSSFSDRLAVRQKAYKRGIDPEEGRRKLEDAAVQIRKQRRDEVVHKKRVAMGIGTEAVASTISPGEYATESTAHLSPMQLQQLYQQLHSGDPEAERLAVHSLGKMCFQEGRLILEEVLHSGLLTRLVSLLSQADQPHLQLECAWVLTNITSGTPEQTRAVVEAGAVPHFLKLLKVQNEELREQAVWALGNIAGDSPELRDLVLTATLPPEAPARARSDGGAAAAAGAGRSVASPTVSATTTAAMGYPSANPASPPMFSGGSSSSSARPRQLATIPPTLAEVGGGLGQVPGMVGGGGPPSEVLALLIALLRDCDTTAILRTASWTLSNLCRGYPLAPFHLITPALGALSNLCYSTDEEVLSEACWALADMAADEQRRPAILQAGVCRRLVELLSNQNAMVQAAALRGVGNVVAGEGRQTQVMLQCGVLAPLKNLVGHNVKAIRREACWAVSNIAAGTPEQIQQVFLAQLIPQIVRTLEEDPAFEVRMEALWTLANIVQGGRLEQVEHLANSGCIGPLVSMLAVKDVRAWQVVVDTLGVLLQVGTVNMHRNGSNVNLVARAVEEAGGFQRMEERLFSLDSDTYAKVEHVLGQYHQAEGHDDELEMSAGSEASGSFGTSHQGRFDFI
mmetsp:Transcript_96658/g.211342  ORF Transcript_96658/g.211342 Transcript_96658/m.211342 type:complete len:626 (-) Transcript_96658:81-1958(-)